jgi:hypothetical protein
LENARRAADRCAEAGPAPVVTAVHIRPNCVLVYGPMVSEGGRTLERFLVTADGIVRGQAPGGSSPAREVVITAHTGLPWSNARMQLRMFP